MQGEHFSGQTPVFTSLFGTDSSIYIAVTSFFFQDSNAKRKEDNGPLRTDSIIFILVT